VDHVSVRKHEAREASQADDLAGGLENVLHVLSGCGVEGDGMRPEGMGLGREVHIPYRLKHGFAVESEFLEEVALCYCSAEPIWVEEWEVAEGQLEAERLSIQ
jgi:hypothetical protein